MPTASSLIGYIASGLVLATFWTNDLRRLRMLAILSNIAFISYGALVWLPPVLGLHLLLLPLNALRLMRMSRTAPRAEYRELLLAKVSMLLERVRCSAPHEAGLPRVVRFAFPREGPHPVGARAHYDNGAEVGRGHPEQRGRQR
jgi:hypothetical protein